jgi:hypothetical protein
VRAEDAMRRAAVAEMRAVDCANVDMSKVVRCAWITEDGPLCLFKKERYVTT